MKYVDFGTAKLLREKGFDEKCFFCYEHDWGNRTCKLVTKVVYCENTSPEDGLRNSVLKEYGGAHWEYVAAPSIPEVLDWLRDKHNLHIYTFNAKRNNENEWCYEVENLYEGWTYSKHYGKSSHDECLEEAISYTLIHFVNGKNAYETDEISPCILERNGFIKKYDEFAKTEFFVSKDSRINITPIDCDATPKIWRCHVDDSDMDTIGRMYISYVSELKQFLKLCGYQDSIIS